MFVHVGHRTIAIACMECLVTGRKERGWGRGRVRRASRGKCQNLSVAGHGPAGMCRTCVRQIISDVRSSVRHRSLGGCRLSLLPVSSAIASRSNFVATYSRALPLATGTRGLERRRGRGILPVGSRGVVVHAWNASCALCEGADEREGNKAPALHILGWGGVGWGGVGLQCPTIKNCGHSSAHAEGQSAKSPSSDLYPTLSFAPDPALSFVQPDWRHRRPVSLDTALAIRLLYRPWGAGY